MPETEEKQEQEQEQNQEQKQEKSGNWYDGLSPDLKNNPTLQKYGSAEDAHKGHLKLQESFGMDKVVWPKDENDTERWGEINKRLGVPEDGAGYDLEAIANPEGVELFDKIKFQDVMKASNAPKNVAQGVWKSYTEMMKTEYAAADTKFKENLANTKTALMKEYGEAYESKVKQGQLVIDTFAKDQDEKDFLTVTIGQDARAMGWLAKIGAQFSESSIAGFQNNHTFTKTPEEAKAKIATIKASPEFKSEDDKIRLPLVEQITELRKQMNQQ